MLSCWPEATRSSSSQTSRISQKEQKRETVALCTFCKGEQEIIENLEAALEQFGGIVEEQGKG